MEQINIDRLDSQPDQRLFASVDYVLSRKIVTLRRIRRGIPRWTDAALGGYQDTFAHARNFVERFAQDSFGLPTAIDIGIIEQGIARLISRDYGAQAGRTALHSHFCRVPGPRQPPTPIRQPAADQRADADRNGLHKKTA